MYELADLYQSQNTVMLFETTKMFIILVIKFQFNKLQPLSTTNAYTPTQHVVIERT